MLSDEDYEKLRPRKASTTINKRTYAVRVAPELEQELTKRINDIINQYGRELKLLTYNRTTDKLEAPVKKDTPDESL